MMGMTKEKLYEEIKITIEETVKSIEKYGGYYIGRYETGNVTNNKETYYGRPVVERMNDKINYVSWYEAYSKMKYLGANAYVKASMISGALWDETLQWLVETEAKTYGDIVNSMNWGNHYDSTFTYTTAGGSIATKNANSRELVLTGSSEYNKANNVYDLAGNILEWTLEVSSSTMNNTRIHTSRNIRGGRYDDKASNLSAHSRGIGNRVGHLKYYGVRAYFYIK